MGLADFFFFFFLAAPSAPCGCRSTPHLPPATKISFLRTFFHLSPWAWVLSSSLFEPCSYCVPYSSPSLPGLVAFIWGSQHFLFCNQFLFLGQLRFRIIILVYPVVWIINKYPGRFFFFFFYHICCLVEKFSPVVQVANIFYHLWKRALTKKVSWFHHYSVVRASHWLRSKTFRAISSCQLSSLICPSILPTNPRKSFCCCLLFKSVIAGYLLGTFFVFFFIYFYFLSFEADLRVGCTVFSVLVLSRCD